MILYLGGLPLMGRWYGIALGIGHCNFLVRKIQYPKLRKVMNDIFEGLSEDGGCQNRRMRKRYV